MKGDFLEVLELTLRIRKLAQETKLTERQFEKIMDMTNSYLAELVRLE